MIVALLAPWFPLLTILLGMAIQDLALPLHAWSVLRPDLSLICLFYWRLYRPDRCGPLLVFLTGLTGDVMGVLPLGLHAFSRILLIILLDHFGSRLRAYDFLIIMPLLGLLVFVEELIHVVLLALFQEVPLFWLPLAGQALGTMLAAPLVVSGLILLHRMLLDPY
ncbi:MAG: rod shape-determining protein MreD [Magnetococcales bacterium]|nr:rod shape-determining protein MreD [Magnetococcales bacterium]